MNAQTGEYYGHDEPSPSYKWGVVIPMIRGVAEASWCTVAWFKTRKAATRYGRSGWNEFAISRLELFGGKQI
jgi:hypothetical protein